MIRFVTIEIELMSVSSSPEANASPKKKSCKNLFLIHKYASNVFVYNSLLRKVMAYLCIPLPPKVTTKATCCSAIGYILMDYCTSNMFTFS